MLEVLGVVQKVVARVAVSPHQGLGLHEPSKQLSRTNQPSKQVKNLRLAISGWWIRWESDKTQPRQKTPPKSSSSTLPEFSELPHSTHLRTTASNVACSLSFAMAKKILPVSVRLSPVDESSTPAITIVWCPSVPENAPSLRFFFVKKVSSTHAAFPTPQVFWKWASGTQ